MEDPLPFLDTNVLLRHLLQDQSDHSPRATAYLHRIERGDIRVRTAETVVFETVFTLQRQYRVPKARIRELLLPLLLLDGIVLPGKRHFLLVFDMYINLNISFIDAYHARLMHRLGLSDIVTFDTDFDRVEGIRRVEP